MKQRKTAYELSESQVATPPEIVGVFWKLMNRHRKKIDTVLDLGSGDCRMASGGQFKKYVGIEIDKSRVNEAAIPKNGRVINNCAFRHRQTGYDACIGNPPYVRHHDIESPWKENTLKRLQQRMGIVFNKHCNLYLYFLSLGLIKIRDNGIIGLVIPYEWVSRPSTKAIRQYILRHGWDVHVYKFTNSIFDGVLTTASVSIIDKQHRNNSWSYYEVTEQGVVTSQKGPVTSGKGVLEYEGRGKLWAMRGLSPGSQKIFTLTEGEFIRFGLNRKDVVPCVTSLKDFPRNLSQLGARSFKKYFRDAGKRCWLIASFRRRRSVALDNYLNSITPKDRDTYTCQNQEPWYNFKPHPVPRLLISSGFKEGGPKVLVNSIKATAVGSVFGIHGRTDRSLTEIQRAIRSIDFEKRVVAHAQELKKIEVKQMNSVLTAITKTRKTHG